MTQQCHAYRIPSSTPPSTLERSTRSVQRIAHRAHGEQRLGAPPWSRCSPHSARQCTWRALRRKRGKAKKITDARMAKAVVHVEVWNAVVFVWAKQSMSIKWCSCFFYVIVEIPSASLCFFDMCCLAVVSYMDSCLYCIILTDHPDRSLAGPWLFRDPGRFRHSSRPIDAARRLQWSIKRRSRSKLVSMQSSGVCDGLWYFSKPEEERSSLSRLVICLYPKNG